MEEKFARFFALAVPGWLALLSSSVIGADHGWYRQHYGHRCFHLRSATFFGGPPLPCHLARPLMLRSSFPQKGKTGSRPSSAASGSLRLAPTCRVSSRPISNGNSVSNSVPSFRGVSGASELRCAIAHRRISRFPDVQRTSEVHAKGACPGMTCWARSLVVL